MNDKSIDNSQKIREITESNFLIHDAIAYRFATKNFNMYPNGKWFSKKGALPAQQDLQRAKDYFASKKK
jgi:hypothetical protein